MNILKKTFAAIMYSIWLFVPIINAQEIVLNASAKINISSTATLVLSNGSKLVNNSTMTVLPGHFLFKGPGKTGIGGTQASTFKHITIDNSTFVDLYTDINVDSLLTLKSGILNLAKNNLTILEKGKIEGSFSASSMISASGEGYMAYQVSGNGTYFYPIGDTIGTDDYSPAKIKFTSGNYNNSIVSIHVKNLKHPSNTSINSYLKRYWTVNLTNLSDFSCDVSFSYVNEDIQGVENNIIGGSWNGKFWSPLNKVAFNEITGNVSSLLDFTGGEQSVLSAEEPIDNFIEVFTSGNTVIIKSKNDFKQSKAELFNINGQLIFIKDLGMSDFHVFDINTGPGIYLLRISGIDKFMIKKLILN